MNMTHEEAVRLRENFYAGLTTPEEEQEWLQWLCSDACPEEWAADREVMLALTVPADVEAPAGLENRIAQLVFGIPAVKGTRNALRWFVAPCGEISLPFRAWPLALQLCLLVLICGRAVLLRFTKTRAEIPMRPPSKPKTPFCFSQSNFATVWKHLTNSGCPSRKVYICLPNFQDPQTKTSFLS